MLLLLVLSAGCWNADSINYRKENLVKKNQLQFEKSPYLLQHATNPVSWHPWGEAAFAKAREENKPVFLSIGYSTCHWCHVMAHESFEDPEVAALMNEAFINIKVDREERPDIDHIYMTVCQMMTGSGGWPLSIVMTAEKTPFFAATYIPKLTRFGRKGLVDLIPEIQRVWEHEPEDIEAISERVMNALRDRAVASPGDDVKPNTLTVAFEQLKQQYDADHGGFGDAPKFPSPHNLLFLSRFAQREPNTGSMEMLAKTLTAMRQGGLWDHVGHGFHRYSTDAYWLLPHFEKMLYDQAMLALAYLDGYQLTRNPEFGRTARELFSYVLRELNAPTGGFYSAEDADSEGEEGKFYLWSEKELQRVLGDTDAEWLSRVLNSVPEGNYLDQATGELTGMNILHLKKNWAELAEKEGVFDSELQERWSDIREKLFAARKERVHPHLDDKILTDWNGLMIAALARGALVLDEPAYAEAAKAAADFILRNMRSGDGLLHRYRDGDAAIPANLDDYAFFIYGLLNLYEVTFDTVYLETALELNDYLHQHFWDDVAGGYYFSVENPDLITRQKMIYDGAVPSGNSVQMLNLLRLARFTGQSELEAFSVNLIRTFSTEVNAVPAAHTFLMSALTFATGPTYEIVVSGKTDADDTKAMFAALREHYLPNSVVLFRPAENPTALSKIAAFTENQTMLDNAATAYVCQHGQCQLPTTSIEKMLVLLGISKPDEETAEE
ncbi:thioredoxin domain-containing protein [bacterium]|nr:thioredoxin domain-containing protein [bacterium]